MSDHTPGRIQLAKEFDGHIMTMDGLAVADCCLDYSSLDHDQQVSNARRLVACWNACEGVSTEALETCGKSLLDGETAELSAQRDELLAALKRARGELQYMASGMTHSAWRTKQAQDAMANIDAVIAKVKGGSA